jgi:hypothetical protein
MGAIVAISTAYFGSLSVRNANLIYYEIEITSRKIELQGRKIKSV